MTDTSALPRKSGQLRYSTIVADPPWLYTKEPTAHRGGRKNTAESQYQTMTNTAIAALPIADLAADDAHLFMWVTNPVLLRQRNSEDGVDPIDICKTWGFQPKSLLTWVKTGAPGMGWYFRGATEHVIHAVRGNAGIPTGQRISNIFEAPRGRHSEKPDSFMDMVERLCPEPRLELFARRARLSGWDYWGNQSLNTAEVAA